MIILSFFFRNEWHYGVIRNPPNLKKYIGFDGLFDCQSQNIFDLFIGSMTKRITIDGKCSPAREREIRSKYEFDTHYLPQDIDEIVKRERVKSSYKIAQNLFLQVRAVYSNADGWRYETVYDEKSVISKKYYSGEGIECLWFDDIKDVISFFNEEK